MRLSIQEFRTMANGKPDETEIGGLGFVPGIAHLRVGQVGRGVRIVLCLLAVVFTMALRWDRFVGAFSTPHFDRWLASVFLLLLLVGIVWYARWDVRRILDPSPEAQSGKGPWRIAMRRFRENRLAVASIYVIVFSYVVAILAPILAPYDPAAIPDVMTNRYLAPSWSHLFGTDEFGRDLLAERFTGPESRFQLACSRCSSPSRSGRLTAPSRHTSVGS